MDQAKYDQRKTCLRALVIIAVFLVVKVLFTTRHDKRLGYLSLRFHLVVMIERNGSTYCRTLGEVDPETILT